MKWQRGLDTPIYFAIIRAGCQSFPSAPLRSMTLCGPLTKQLRACLKIPRSDVFARQSAWHWSQLGTGDKDSLFAKAARPTEWARGSQRATTAHTRQRSDCFARSASSIWATLLQDLGSQRKTIVRWG